MRSLHCPHTAEVLIVIVSVFFTCPKQPEEIKTMTIMAQIHADKTDFFFIIFFF
jgi:hypothetical protein